MPVDVIGNPAWFDSAIARIPPSEMAKQSEKRIALSGGGIIPGIILKILLKY